MCVDDDYREMGYLQNAVALGVTAGPGLSAFFTTGKVSLIWDVADELSIKASR